MARMARRIKQPLVPRSRFWRGLEKIRPMNVQPDKVRFDTSRLLLDRAWTVLIDGLESPLPDSVQIHEESLEDCLQAHTPFGSSQFLMSSELPEPKEYATPPPLSPYTAPIVSEFGSIIVSLVVPKL